MSEANVNTQNTLNQISNNVKFDTLKIVAKLDIASGMRLCRIINKGAKESLGAHIAGLSYEDVESMVLVEPKLRSFIVDAFMAAQDKLARAKLQADGSLNLEEISFDQITASIVESLESKGRISKEAIETWYVATMHALIEAALKAKGVTQQKQIDDTSKAFKDSFSSLAGRNVSMADKIKAQLEKALMLLPDDYESSVVEFIAGKLSEVTEAVAIQDAL